MVPRVGLQCVIVVFLDIPTYAFERMIYCDLQLHPILHILDTSKRLLCLASSDVADGMLQNDSALFVRNAVISDRNTTSFENNNM